MRTLARLTFVVGSVTLLTLLGSPGMAALEQREIFSGMVARMSGPGVGPATGQLQITIGPQKFLSITARK